MEILSLLGVLAVPAAWAAALWARSSAREAKRLADIEADRRHEEREPKVSVWYERQDALSAHLYFVNEDPIELVSANASIEPLTDEARPLSFRATGDDAPLVGEVALGPLRPGIPVKKAVRRNYAAPETVRVSLVCVATTGEQWSMLRVVDLPDERRPTAHFL